MIEIRSDEVAAAVAVRPTIQRTMAAPSWPSALSLTWTERAALLIVMAGALRMLVATTTGLSDTEAYYAQWARSPALSYYDHPPLVAWTTWLATHLSSAPAAVRVGPVLYAAAFDALVFALASRLFSARAGFYAVAILTAIPAFFFTGFLLNPEGLLAPLWVGFLLLLVGLPNEKRAWRPLALGAVVGVTFLAKYTAVLAVPVTLLVVATSPRGRRWFKRPAFYAAGLVALVLTTPVLAWNATHGWPTLHLHLSERMSLGASESIVEAVGRVARGQFLLFQPLLLSGLVGALGVTVARSARDERYRFLLLASAPVLGFLLVAMVRAKDSEPHWTMMGYLPLVIAAAGILDDSSGALKRTARGIFGASITVSAVLATLYAVHFSTPALAKHVPSYDPNVDPYAETLGWDDIKATIDSHAAKLGPSVVVAGAHNVLCGHVEAALDDTPNVYCLSPRRTQFDFVGRRALPEGAPVVFVDSARYPADLDAALPRYTCAAPEEVVIDREGLPQTRYRVRDCAPAP